MLIAIFDDDVCAPPPRFILKNRAFQPSIFQQAGVVFGLLHYVSLYCMVKALPLEIFKKNDRRLQSPLHSYITQEINIEL